MKTAKCIMPENKKWETRRVRTYLHEHEVYGGANRPLSQKYGLVVYLTPAGHNMTKEGPHFNAAFMDELHQAGQRAFEKAYPELNFFQIFGINYLEEREFHHDDLFRIGYRKPRFAVRSI